MVAASRFRSPVPTTVTSLLGLTLASSAAAAPVEGALQLRLTPAAMDLGAAFAEDLDPVFFEEELSAVDIECYDRLGVRDFNLDVPIDSVVLTPGDGTLAVSVSLGTVYGEDMLVFGEDEDYIDACPEFESELVYASLVDGRLDATLAASRASDGSLLLEWVEPPLVTGDLDTDISWFPDDLVLYFVEDSIFEVVSDTVAAELPPALEALLGEAVLEGGYGDLEGGLALSEVELTTGGLWMSAEADLSFSGTPACTVPDTPWLTMDRAELALADAEDDHVGLGMTERFVGEVLGVAWQAGWFCIESESVADAVEDLARFVDPDVVTGRAYGSLDSAPVLTMTAQGMRLSLTGLHAVVEGEIDGQPADLVDVTMDIEAAAGLTMDSATGTVQLQLLDPEIDVTDLDLAGFQAGTDGVVGRTVEKLVTRSVTEDLAAIPMFDGLYRGFGYVLRLSRFTPEQDGLAAWLHLYAEDDPAVDSTAPDTTAQLDETTRTGATVSFAGSDDRDGTLAFSVQVDGLGWSDWSAETTVTVDDLEPGDHLVEVKARDAWLNEDPSPASVDFTLEEPGTALLPEDCGCTGAAPAGLLALPGVLVAVLRRRRG